MVERNYLGTIVFTRSPYSEHYGLFQTKRTMETKRSFAREDAPVLPLFGVLPSFCSSPTAGRVSISWRSHVGAWPGEVLSEQPKIKNLPLGVGSAASLWNCQLNPRSCLSFPRVATARLSMPGFSNLSHAKTRPGALQKASPRT